MKIDQLDEVAYNRKERELDRLEDSECLNCPENYMNDGFCSGVRNGEKCKHEGE